MSTQTTQPNTDIAPQSDKSSALVKSHRFGGKGAMIITAAGAVFAYVSQYIGFGKAVIDWLQVYDYLAGRDSKSAELLRYLFSPLASNIFFILFLMAFFFTVYRTVHPKRSFERTAKGGSDVEKTSEKKEQNPVVDVVKLEGRITELESENAALQWLHEIAEKQKKYISRWVIFRCYQVDHQHDAVPTPYMDFKFTAYNTSVYSISLEFDLTAAYVKFRDSNLSGNMKVMDNNVKNLESVQESVQMGQFTLRLWLTPAESEFINSTPPKYDRIIFKDVRVIITGGDRYPEIKPVASELPTIYKSNQA